MDRPDTIVELHRSVVEEITTTGFPPKKFDPVPVDGQPLFAGEAHVAVGVSRVWFYEDANGRRWEEAAGTPDAGRERHFAIDLRLADHPSGLPDSHIKLTELLGGRPPTVPPTQCRGKTIPADVIPLPGRVTIHEQLDRIASTIQGAPGQNIVLEFASQPAPVLVSSPPRAGVDARVFGPGVQRGAGGRVTLTGNDPRVVWELTREEQLCIVRSTAGLLLVARAGSEDAALEAVAAELTSGIASRLTGSGDGGTSMKSILENREGLPPDQVGIRVGPECTTRTEAIEIDARVKSWNRPQSGDPAESLVFQLRTVEGLPDDSVLPPSVLALRELEQVAFSRAGWAILRSIRCSQIKSLCLSEDDFDPGEGCRLSDEVGIVIGDTDGTLERFAAEFVRWPDHPGLGLLRIGGRAEGSSFLYEWWMEFEIDFKLDRGEAPREPRDGERQERSGSLADIDARIDELYLEKCTGGRSREEIDEDIEDLLAEKKLPPQTIGVKPIDVRVTDNGDATPTLAGLLLGLAIVATLTIITGGAAFGFSGGVVFSFFVLGVALGGAAVSTIDSWVLDTKLMEKIAEFMNDNRDQTGEASPLDGYQPIHVELKRTSSSPDAYTLNAYLEDMPAMSRALWREPDLRRPLGDPDYVNQWVAGKMPADDRVWMLTVPDAVRYIAGGRLRLTVADPAAPGGEAELHVATSSRGRRYLRTDPDVSSANNLQRLPPLPD